MRIYFLHELLFLKIVSHKLESVQVVLTFTQIRDGDSNAENSAALGIYCIMVGVTFQVITL